MCFEHKDLGDRVVDEDERVLGAREEEGDSRVNVDQDAKNGLRGAIQVAHGPTVLQSLPQGPVVRWDRFLPIRSLKVLLVENDDSTRHVVGALLRNCSYEVNGVANGLQAWKILEDPNNHTDIILTEVVMPVISGVALLCKIMSHKSLKNIPVIMMSSHDSMGLVFKCLSKGAVDFLVKPIRKNELKNLWQHVWRRCLSSSGSGSESGTQSRRYNTSKSNNGESENSSSSSEEQCNGSTGLSIRGGSDHGSGTQGSRAVEVRSPRSPSPSDQLADTPDSTCGQVIHTKPEKYANGWAHSTEAKECTEQDKRFDDMGIGKDLEVGATRKPDLHWECQLKKSSFPLTIKKQNKLPEVDGHQGPLDHRENVNSCANANCAKPQFEGRTFGSSNGISDISHINGNYESGDHPSHEFSLKRLRGAGDSGNSAALDDCNVLRHSDLSAFSKYNTPRSGNQAPTGNVGSCSLFGSSSVAPITGPSHKFPYNSNTTPPNQQSNESSNNNDMAASTNKYNSPKPETFNENPEPTSAFKSSRTSAFQPVQNGCGCLSPQVPTGDTGDEEAGLDEAADRHAYQKVQVQHHHHHHHHYHHHVHNMQQDDHDDDLSLNNMAASAQQCGSSNVFGGIVDSQPGNYSVNGSVSGSNHGSNAQNGSSAALNAGMMNVESDMGLTENGGVGGGGICNRNSGIGVDESRVAQREAALTKFRQKRKERCFEKKVRYQSRKKLAEQRPRIRGQFVRQIVSDTKTGEECQSEDFKSEDNSGNSVQ